MTKIRFSQWILSIFCLTSLVCAQSAPSPASLGELRLHLASSHSGGMQHSIPAVIWLEPLTAMPSPGFLPQGRYTLLQKNRMFVPHLQVIPVGAAVQFPNADPFFHNVFSLFNGKRFDLGLYEAGSSKSVIFPREGVSYIFCNIHPEMSAVVLALSTPLFAVADEKDAFVLPNIPSGDYNLHIWVEGVPQTSTDRLTRRVHLLGRSVDLGAISVPAAPNGTEGHRDKFGNAYDPAVKPPYHP